MTALSEEDKNLFRQAVADARPLESQTSEQIQQAQNQQKRKWMSRRQRLKRRQQRANTVEHPDEFAKDLHYEPHHTVSAFESMQYERQKLKPKDWKKLKKGDFQTYWHLDLHGETVDSADRILLNFLQEAHQQNARYVIIVHGKGYHSDSDTPALKNLVNSRLRQLPFVLAFCSAQPKDGGTGAVYVFLKN